MSTNLRLMTVHAHPDDESSKGASTVAKYKAEGIPSTLVCCTGGEAGDVLNPAMDRPEVRDNIAAVRLDELDRAAAIIGYEKVELLGYHDSGMPDSETNQREDNFWNAPLDESTGRLVELIRRDRPQVIVTYGDDQKHYAHPDHLRVHDISLLAWARAGDPQWYPELGDPWEPLKLYYTIWSRRRMMGAHEKFLELGLKSPFDDAWVERMSDTSHDDKVTTMVPIYDHYQAREDALRAHATQVDPESAFWFGLPADVSRDLHPFDDYILAKSRPGIVDSTTDDDGGAVVEDDLFAGVR